MRLSAPLLLLAAACTDGGLEDENNGTDTSISVGLCDGITTTPGVAVETSTFAIGINVPTDIVNAGDGSHRLYVTSQTGTIYAYDESGNRFDFANLKLIEFRGNPQNPVAWKGYE